MKINDWQIPHRYRAPANARCHLGESIISSRFNHRAAILLVPVQTEIPRTVFNAGLRISDWA
jgi:hypothetical protein